MLPRKPALALTVALSALLLFGLACVGEPAGRQAQETAAPAPTPVPASTSPPGVGLESLRETLELAFDGLDVEQLANLAENAADAVCAVASGVYAPALELDDFTDSTLVKAGVVLFCESR